MQPTVKNEIEDRRIFLLVGENARRARMQEIVASHIGKAQFVHAADGSEAILKVRNAPPHVVILDEGLAKVSATKVVEWILDAKDLQDMACILVSALPEEEQFVDQVVIGRVQYLENLEDTPTAAKTLARALNSLNLSHKHEFNVRFLAPSEQLMREGEKAAFVYILKRGQLEASTMVHGEKRTLGTVEEGEFVGEMAYINGEPRSADVVATRDSELIEIPVNVMDHLLFLKPAWSKALMQTLSRRIKRNNAALAGS